MDEGLINRYKKINWKGLLREDLGASGNLVEAKETLDRIKVFFDRLLNSSIVENQDGEISNRINERLKQFLEYINNEVLIFSDVRKKDDILQGIKQQERDLINNLMVFASYINSFKKQDSKELEQKIENIHTYHEKAEEGYIKINKLLTEVRRSSQEEKAFTFGKEFKDQADIHRGNAQNNFYILFCIIAATVIFAFILLKDVYFIPQENLANLQALLNFIVSQNLFVHAVIFSLFAFSISHFSRNFASEKNLEYINKQRQNALDAHRQILDTVDDSIGGGIDAQNELLVLLAKAMFENQPTGYLKGMKHSTNPLSTFLNIQNK